MMSCKALVSTCIAALVLTSSTVLATGPIKKAFEEKYVEPSGSADFEAAFKELGCNICHIEDEKRDFVNTYGWKLAELIPGNVKDRTDEARKQGIDARKAEDEKLAKEYIEALKKAETAKTASGEMTFGELFKALRLPTQEGAKSIRE